MYELLLGMGAYVAINYALRHWVFPRVDVGKTNNNRFEKEEVKFESFPMPDSLTITVEEEAPEKRKPERYSSVLNYQKLHKAVTLARDRGVAFDVRKLYKKRRIGRKREEGIREVPTIQVYETFSLDYLPIVSVQYGDAQTEEENDFLIRESQRIFNRLSYLFKDSENGPVLRFNHNQQEVINLPKIRENEQLQTIAGPLVTSSQLLKKINYTPGTWDKISYLYFTYKIMESVNNARSDKSDKVSIPFNIFFTSNRKSYNARKPLENLLFGQSNFSDDDDILSDPRSILIIPNKGGDDYELEQTGGAAKITAPVDNPDPEKLHELVDEFLLEMVQKDLDAGLVQWKTRKKVPEEEVK